MPDWPRHHLLPATSVHIKSAEGGREYEWEMSGEDFVRCLESGGWRWDAVRRCRFNRTDQHGTITAERPYLGDFDGDLTGPWFFVEFDHGFRCWVRSAEVTTYIDRNQDWPTRPSTGASPPETDADRFAILEHAANLIEGAQQWLDLLDDGTGQVDRLLDRVAQEIRDTLRVAKETK